MVMINYENSMKSLATILVSIISFTSIAQTTFQKTYLSIDYDYSYAREIIQTSDGGYATIGETTYPITYDSDVLLHKFDVNGNLMWTKTYGGTLDEYGESVQQTSDGGYIISGFKGGILSGDDFFIIKTNSIGDTIWTKIIGGASSSGEWSYSIIETSTGDFVACGYTYSYGQGSSDIYVIKLNSSGTIQWSKTYGDIDSDNGNQIRETSDGGYIITGNSENSTNYKDDAFLLKIDVNGTLLWNKTYGTFAEDDRVSAVYQLPAPDNGFVIVGETTSSGATNDFYVVRTNDAGVEQWSYAYDGGGTDYADDVCSNGSGGFIISGSTYSFGGDDALLINIDANGNVVWSKIYGIPGAAYARSVIQTADGGFAFSGELSDNVFIVKMDASGNSGCNQNNVTVTKSAISNVSNSTFVAGNGGVEYNGTIDVLTRSVSQTIICLNISANEITKDANINIYPNPFSVSTTVKFLNFTGDIYRLDLFDFTGKLIRSITDVKDNRVILSRENINSGIYLIQLKDNNGLIYSKKVIIE